MSFHELVEEGRSKDFQMENSEYCAKHSGFARASLFLTFFPRIFAKTAFSTFLPLMVYGMSVTG